MVINNPYRALVQSDNNILDTPEKIYIHKGMWSKYFGNSHDLILEIGTGMGNFFGKQVIEQGDKNFIGMEIKYKRLYQSAKKARKSGNNNFVMLKDFGQNIDKVFIPGEVSATYIFFPDPWANKDRQKKHRIMQAIFLSNLYNITKSGGKLYFKTDHREYFEATKEIIQEQGLWKIITWTHCYENTELFDMGNITEFESFYRGEKTDINYIQLMRS